MPKTSEIQQRSKIYYKQKYRKEWKNESVFKGWLTKASENSQNKGAYCKVCLTFLSVKHKSLLDHAQIQKHIAAMKEQINIITIPKIDNLVKHTITESRKIAELKLAFFIAEHTSIKTIDNLSAVIKSLDNESSVLRQMQIHRSKCTSLIKNILSPCILQELLDDVGNSFFLLLVVESTVIDAKKLLCLVIRYVSVKKSKVVTTFYRLIEMESGTSDAIANAILKQLKSDNLCIDELLGLGVDGASVNVGKKHSLSTNLKNVNPCITVIKCICHSLHLAAEKACDSLPRNLDYMIRETYNWFSHSTKRQLEYKDIFILITDKREGPKKLTRLRDTRWLVREKAICTVVEQWDSLNLHFQLAETKEKDYIALQLANMYKSDENKLYLIFIHSILKPVILLNKSFQSDRVDPIKLLEELNDLFYSILQKIVVPAHLEKVSRSKISSIEFLFI